MEKHNVFYKGLTNLIKPPEYLDAASRPAYGKFNDQTYFLKIKYLQEAVNGLSFPSALSYLHQQQLDIGFISSDRSEIKHYYFVNRKDKSQQFNVQLNRARAKRTQGFGRNALPAGLNIKNMDDFGCFLCFNNVSWQQSSLQTYFIFWVNSRHYIALCNPFSLASKHFTISSIFHEPQSWHVSHASAYASGKVQKIVEDIYDISSHLPNYACFFNGLGSGATIEKHLHYHVLEKSPLKEFPLQVAAAKVIENDKSQQVKLQSGANRTTISEKFYPLLCFKFSGDRRAVIYEITQIILKWNSILGSKASGNILALSENSHVNIYFVPREQADSAADVVGGLEMLGEFVMSSDFDFDRLKLDIIDFKTLWKRLAAVKSLALDKLL